ncbi:MAG: transposase [Vulcanimicrobiota bacterium]
MARQVGCHRNRREEPTRPSPESSWPCNFGSGLKPHVHFHILVTDGVYFPDGSYFALGFWEQPSLLSELRHSILKSLVARKCLQPETAKLLESRLLDRSGFSAFVGDPISQPADRPRLQRVLNYILRRL